MIKNWIKIFVPSLEKTFMKSSFSVLVVYSLSKSSQQYASGVKTSLNSAYI